MNKWFFMGVVVGLPIALITSSNVVSVVSRVVDETLRTENIISNYEWYHDANAQFLARVNQVKQFKAFVDDPNNDAVERRRTRIELAAVQQSCRELATQYNANSEKINRGVFKGWSLPETLSVLTCE